MPLQEKMCIKTCEKKNEIKSAKRTPYPFKHMNPFQKRILDPALALHRK